MGSSLSVLGSSPRTASSFSSSMPIPKFQHPSHALLEDNGFKQMKYVKYYKRCIEDRQKMGGWGGGERGGGGWRIREQLVSPGGAKSCSAAPRGATPCASHAHTSSLPARTLCLLHPDALPASRSKEKTRAALLGLG